MRSFVTEVTKIPNIF